MQFLGGGVDLGADVVRGLAGDLKSEADVGRDVHMRIEGVGLEHHGNAALGRLGAGDVLAVDPHLAGGGRFEAGDDPEQRRLAASRRTDQGAKLAVLDREIEGRNDFQGAERLGNGPKF